MHTLLLALVLVSSAHFFPLPLLLDSLLVEQSLGPLQRFRKAQRLEVVSREPPKLKY